MPLSLAKEDSDDQNSSEEREAEEKEAQAAEPTLKDFEIFLRNQMKNPLEFLNEEVEERMEMSFQSGSEKAVEEGSGGHRR